MNKLSPFIVPKGIKFISDIPNFAVPDFPCIIDKKLTGCGFTEWVLRDNVPTILISPRTNLLKNKEAQHNKPILDSQGNIIGINQNVYYAKCKEVVVVYDKDIQTSKPKEIKEEEFIINYPRFKQDLEQAIFKFNREGKVVKILVTYDSFRKVREILEQMMDISRFRMIVDEFQSIFVDGKFKSTTEMEFMTALRGLQRVSYVSATPMMEEYLEMIPEFNSISYWELDWYSDEPSRVTSPEIIANPTRSINETAKKIITEFKAGKFHKRSRLDSFGNPIEVVEARELNIFVNSVKNICDIIRQNRLVPEEVDVICADTSENRKKVRDAFRKSMNSLGLDKSEVSKRLPKETQVLAEVPVPDPITGIVPIKPYTFCTKTVYLGADFYNDAARCIVLSDATVECMAVDITLDLPQIGGRFRNDLNPWKNCIEIWFREGVSPKDMTPEKAKETRDKKIKKTEALLRSFERSLDSDKKDLAEAYEYISKTKNYKDDYVAVNHHAGSTLVPQFNHLVMIAEQRAFEIMQKDYASRFTVFNKIDEVFGQGSSDVSKHYSEVLDEINQSGTTFPERMKKCCELIHRGERIEFIPDPFRTYLQVLGTSFISSKAYRKCFLDEALENRSTSKIFTKDDLEEVIYGYFQEGQKYLKSQLKQDLGEIYQKLGVVDSPKANDIQKWFEIRPTSVYIPELKRSKAGFELIKRKNNDLSGTELS